MGQWRTSRTGGFSLVEALATAAVIIIIAGMGMSTLPVMRKAQVQGRAVSKMKLLAKFQEDFRGTGDLGVNPEGTYASFEQLQNAGYIARDMELEDTVGHGGTPFIPFYKLSIGRDIASITVAPDAFNYAVVAEPVGAPRGLPILYMEEDGLVFTIDPDGTQRTLR